LPQHRPIPSQADPGQVIKDLFLPFGPRPALIEIFYSQYKFAALPPRKIMRDYGGIGMSKM
jgi:hypothetical protein